MRSLGQAAALAAVAMLTATGEVARGQACGAWSAIGNTFAPGPRTGTSNNGFSVVAYDSARQRVVLLGQGPLSITSQGDVWEWDGAVWTQRLAPTSDLALNRYAVYDSLRGVTVVTTRAQVVYEYNGQTATLTLGVSKPANCPINQCTGAFDAARGEVVQFGGGLSSSSSNQTWVYNGSAWTQRSPATSPPARSFAALAYDARRRLVIMHGGVDSGSGTILSDTWAWDGTNWAPLPNGPARSGHTIVYDTNAGVIVLLPGGTSPGGVSDTQGTYVLGSTQWDGVANASARPQPVQGFVLGAYDAARGEIISFGGSGTQVNPLPDWAVRFALGRPAMQVPPANQSVRAGDTAAFAAQVSAVVSSQSVLTYQWQKNGVNLPGRTAPFLFLSNVAQGDAGTYTLVATNLCGSVSASATLSVSPACPGDGNRDGVINFLDLSNVVGNYGQTCPQ